MLQTPKVHLLHEIFNSRFSQYSLLHHSIRETLKVLCKMFTVCSSLFSSTLKNIFCPFIASSIWKYRILFQFWGKREQVFDPFCSCVRRLFSRMMWFFSAVWWDFCRRVCEAFVGNKKSLSHGVATGVDAPWLGIQMSFPHHAPPIPDKWKIWRKNM